MLLDKITANLTQNEQYNEIKENVGTISTTATFTAVFAVAGAVTALALGILCGGVIAGMIGFTLCTVIAILSNDVRMIANKIQNETFLDQLGRAVKFTQTPAAIIKNAVADAAGNSGTVLIGPRCVHFAASIIAETEE